MYHCKNCSIEFTHRELELDACPECDSTNIQAFYINNEVPYIEFISENVFLNFLFGNKKQKEKINRKDET